MHRNSSLFITCDVLIDSDIADLLSFIGCMLHCYKDACMHAVHLFVHMSVCPSVCLHVSAGQLLDRFSLNFLLKTFIKMY